MDEWISVKESLPITDKKWGVKVLVHVVHQYRESKRKEHHIRIISFAQNQFWIDHVGGNYYPASYAEVTHWMPLPKYPKP